MNKYTQAYLNITEFAVFIRFISQFPDSHQWQILKYCIIVLKFLIEVNTKWEKSFLKHEWMSHGNDINTWYDYSVVVAGVSSDTWEVCDFSFDEHVSNKSFQRDSKNFLRVCPALPTSDSSSLKVRQLSNIKRTSAAKSPLVL